MPPSLTSPNERLPTGPWLKTALLGVLVAAVSLGGLELGLRGLGYGASVNDDAGLWALEYRDRPDDAWLMLGTSRAVCGVDLDTFEDVTGEDVVQLAISAGHPIPVLTFLDEQGFDGKLIVELSPFVWFTDNPLITQQAELFVQTVDDQERALFGGLERRTTREFQAELRILHSETDLFDLVKAALKRSPPVIRQTVRRDRQRYCWPSRHGAAPAVDEPDLSQAVTFRAERHEERFEAAIAAIQGIVGRGGTVLMFAPPESGAMRNGHLLDYPEDVYAEVLVERAGVPYVNTTVDSVVMDIPVPDYSHIDASDAPRFTDRLVALFRQQGYFNEP